MVKESIVKSMHGTESGMKLHMQSPEPNISNFEKALLVAQCCLESVVHPSEPC